MVKENELLDALYSVVWQFGYRGVRSGQAIISTGGLSALEEAFDVLGWDDPHIVDDESILCDVLNCPDFMSAQLHWNGVYSRICSNHSRQLHQNTTRPEMKSHAVKREALRDERGVLPAGWEDIVFG